MSLPSYITLIRIILVPLQIYLIYHFKWPALALFLVMAFTDWLDGFIARKYSQISDTGKFLDPLADKIFVMSLLLVFLVKEYIEIYSMIFLLAREFSVQGLRMFSLERGQKAMGASKIAKWKTFILMVGLFLFVMEFVFWGRWFYYAGVLLALLSMIDYFWKNRHLFKTTS